MNESRQRRQSRIKFALLLAIFLLPLLIAVLWYNFGARFTPAADTHGELFEPAQPLQPFQAKRVAGGDYDLDALRGRWTLLHVIDARCTAECRERIYFTRQIHTALGHERLRVQRVAALPDDTVAVDLSALLPRHPDLTVITEADNLLAQLPEQRTASTVFLLDPIGNLVLRFDRDVAPEGIRDDLEQLLRLSQIG